MTVIKVGVKIVPAVRASVVKMGPVALKAYRAGAQGIPGPPGAGVEVQEVAIGEINGVNATFQSSSPFDPSTLKVYDRVLLTQPDDYINIGNNTIQLTFSPEEGEEITLIYIKTQ